MNHLVMTSLLMVATHIACFAAMTERKYSVKKTLLLYGLYALFFIVWALLAFMLLGKTSPHVISFSFVGTIVPAVALFLYTSADSFSKKLFLILTYANIFCIILCLSVLLCDSLLPGLSSVGQIYARSIVRTALNIPAILLYLRYARPYMRTVPGNKRRTWYSISLVSALFLFVFSLLVALIMRNTRDTVYSMLFGTTTVIFVAVLWVIFGTIQSMSAEARMELISQNVQYLQGQLATARENAMAAKAMRHDFRHHMQNLALLLRQEKPQEAEHYIEEFIHSLDTASQIDFCPHVTVNAILNNFYNRTQKEGIAVSVTAEVPEDTAIADMDFVAILSNLLENARNGCTACGSHGKITVSLRIKKGKLVIVCSNPCAPGLVIVDDMIEPKGTGIESILMAVDKYDGNIRYHLQDGIVTVSLVLNC